jgi:Holliday junction resolvasome RuvABC endonuclease subunit
VPRLCVTSTGKEEAIVKILALDMATRAGWATNVYGKKSGYVEFNQKRGESPGMRFLRCRAWLKEMLTLLGGSIDLVVYELPHHRGGAATVVTVGLMAEVLSFAAENGIETMAVHSATLKKFATGSGRANKKDMVRAAKRLGWDDVEDDNEADASLLLGFAAKELQIEI